MKITVKILIVFLISLQANAQWYQVHSDSTESLVHISFADTLVGYCIGGNGNIFKSIDAGENWNSINLSFGNPISDFAMLTETTGLIVTTLGVHNYLIKVNFPTGFSDTIYRNNQSFQQRQIIEKRDNIYYIAMGKTLLKIDDDLNILDSISFTKAISAISSNELENKILLVIEESAFQIRNIAEIDLQTFQSTIIGSMIWDGQSCYNMKVIEYFDDYYLRGGFFYGGSLRKSENATDWEYVYPNHINDFEFTDSKIREDGVITLITTNGLYFSGTSLNTIKIDTIYTAGSIPYFNDLHWLNNKIGFICSKQGIVYKTTNGGGITGINETENQKEKIKIYPNPAKGLLNLTLVGNLKINNMVLYDISGKLVKTYSATERELSIKGLSSGQYLLKLNTEKGIITKKVQIE